MSGFRLMLIETRPCDASWFCNICLDSVVREVNVRVLGKGLELLSAAYGGRFEINQLLFADDTAL